MTQLTKRALPSPMSVPLLDLKLQYQALAPEIMPILEQICAEQQFILGPQVTAFEAATAAYCKSRHGVGVSSGTDALLLALMALGIGAGDEVVTTTFSFFATAGAIARTGARPVFCDIEAGGFNLDLTAVRAFLVGQCDRVQGDLINGRTGGRVKALMPVHLYGQCVAMTPLLQLAREFELKVIEDAAQAIGADDADGQRACSTGTIGCLSFFPSKNLGAFGDAGLCTTQDDELAEHLRVLRVHGGKPKYLHAFIGGNFRIDALQAAVLDIKLRHLDTWTAGRQRNADYYFSAFREAGLAQALTLPVAGAGRHIWNQFVIRVPRRDALKQFLSERGIASFYS
jgi:dTDP-4-amino-4,6-dideoxygalactose transaminase